MQDATHRFIALLCSAEHFVEQLECSGNKQGARLTHMATSEDEIGGGYGKHSTRRTSGPGSLLRLGAVASGSLDARLWL
jgi:hypothetical protein